MPDGTVEVIYRTKAELQGAQQMQQSLEKTIGQKKALGEAYTKEEAQLKKVNATLLSHAQATVKSAEASAQYFQEIAKARQGSADMAGALSKMTQEAKSAAPGVAGAGVSLKGLGTAAFDAATQLPIVGAGVAAMANPITAAIALAGAASTAFLKWQSAIDAAGISIEQFSPGSQHFSTVARSMQDISDRAAEFQESLRLQAADFGRIEAATARTLTGIQQNTTAQRQALDSERELALARIALREQTEPGFTKQDAGAARRGVRADFRQRSRALGLGETDATLAAQRAERDAMRKDAFNSEERLPALEKDLQAKMDRVKSLGITTPRNVTALTEEKAKNEKRLAFITNVLSGTAPLEGATGVFSKDTRDLVGKSREDLERIFAHTTRRNATIGTRISDILPAEQQGAAKAAELAASKVTEARMNIQALQPGGRIEPLEGQIALSVAQRARQAGTLSASGSNLELAGEGREAAAQIAELKEALKAVFTALKQNVTQLDASGIQANTATISTLNKQLSTANREAEALRAKVEEALND